jgi:hypothetical protein
MVRRRGAGDCGVGHTFPPLQRLSIVTSNIAFCIFLNMNQRVPYESALAVYATSSREQMQPTSQQRQALFDELMQSIACLNPAQKTAVCADRAPQVIVAGACSE